MDRLCEMRIWFVFVWVVTCIPPSVARGMPRPARANDDWLDASRIRHCSLIYANLFEKSRLGAVMEACSDECFMKVA